MAVKVRKDDCNEEIGAPRSKRPFLLPFTLLCLQPPPWDPPLPPPAAGVPAAKRSTWTTSRALQDRGCPLPALGLDSGHSEGAS